MKYKDKDDFAEKVINKVPFVQNMNVNVRVTKYSIGYTSLEGKSFNGGLEITQSLMDHLSGMINGLRYAYDFLKGGEVDGSV